VSVLSDLSIKILLAGERLVVSPLAEGAVQPASVDLRLGDELLMRDAGGVVDLSVDQAAEYAPVHASENGRWLLFPERLYLATTFEWIRIPDDLVGHLHGRSTAARAGVVCHQQAGLLDPGYEGRPTLEITVVYPTYLRPRMPIAQLELLRLTSRAERPYLGRYQGASAPQPPRLLPSAGGAS
jgi:dCTP deaminase